MIYGNKDRALLRFADQNNPQFGFHNHMCINFLFIFQISTIQSMQHCCKSVFVIIINIMATFFSSISWFVYWNCNHSMLQSLKLSIKTFWSTLISKIVVALLFKRSTGLNINLSIRGSAMNSCQKGSYLQSNSPMMKWIKINNGIRKKHHNPFIH